MDTISILKQTYGCGVPILLKDIRIGGKSKTSIRQELSRAVKKGEIIRKWNGVYCFKKENSYVTGVTFEDILSKKYIRGERGTLAYDLDIYGYYTGYMLINWLGISPQVPAVPQITTNKTSCNREIKKGNRRALIYKSKVEINFQNYRALQLFDMFYWLSDAEYQENKEKLVKYFFDICTIKDFDYLKYFRGQNLMNFYKECMDYEISRQQK